MREGVHFGRPAGDKPRGFKARITAVAGSFPVWSYTVQRVIGRDQTKTDQTQWMTDGVDITGVLNTFEWTPAGYPFLHAVGVTVADNTGAVAKSFGGSTAGTCLIRAIGVGVTVWIDMTVNKDGTKTYGFAEPNSAQP